MAYTPRPGNLSEKSFFRVANWLQPPYLNGYPIKIGIG